MPLSSAQLDARVLPAAAGVTLFTVGAGDRALLRDVRVANGNGATRAVYIFVAKPGGAGIYFVYLPAMPGGSVHAIADAFMVLEPGDQVLAYASGSDVGVLLSGHYWPNAGPSAP